MNSSSNRVSEGRGRGELPGHPKGWYFRGEGGEGFLLISLFILALGYRIFLSQVFYGWEESDYGNLAMTRGVLDSWFTRYDIGHLAFYYFLSSLLLMVTGDTVLSAKGVSIISGSLSIVVAYLLAKRFGGKRCALLAALFLVFQPEFSLYASSSLREPLYTLLILSALLFLMEKRRFYLSLLLAGLAFLTRFDAIGTTFLPILIWLALNRNTRKRLVPALLMFGGVVVGWSLYCKLYHGTFLFFMPTAVVNVKTGMGGGNFLSSDFILNGIETSALLFLYILPMKTGYPLVLFFIISLASFIGQATRRGGHTLFLLFTFFSIAFWLSIGFYIQHEYGHNLYWKWMYPVVPFVVILGSSGIINFSRNIGERLWTKRGRVIYLIPVSVFLINAPFFVRESLFQIKRSDALYRPQMEIARWIEREVPEGSTLILDNIPACYMNRRHHDYRLLTWLDIRIPTGERADFARFLREEKVSYLMWFREEWTRAPLTAPYLGEAKVHLLDGLKLTPLKVNEEYGFIFYRVEEMG